MSDEAERPWHLRWWAFLLYALVVLAAVGAVILVFRGGSTTSEFTTASNPQLATPSVTPLVAYTAWPPGTASVAQTLAVADEFAARMHAETLWSANVLAADSTMDIWIADEHYKGAQVRGYFSPTEAGRVLDWSKPTVLAAAGTAAVEGTARSTPVAMRFVEVLTISHGKVTHQEVYGDTGSGSAAPPKPVAARPGAADTAAEAKATVNAYYAALPKGDAAVSAALYSLKAVFQDTTHQGKAGDRDQAIAWQIKLAAVPNVSLQVKSLVAGKGWAVARWLFSGRTKGGLWHSVPGATVFEVRGGRIVRQTLYYNYSDSPLY
jgi:ketosteroid isomerase-like protein